MTADLDAAANLNIPAIDGDFAGRAVPETPQFRYSIAGMKIWPRVFCDYAGNVTIIKGAIIFSMMEGIQKHGAMSCFGLVGVAGHLIRGDEMRGVIIPQTISGCITIGASIRRAKSQKESFIEEVADSVGGRVLFQGRVTQKIWESRDGYMIGHVELEGEKQFLGHTFKIWFKNDYHVSWLDQKPFVTSPDIISIIDVHSTEVPANTDIDRGNRLGVIGLKAAEAYRTRKGCEVLGPSHFGFGIDYVPIEERVRSR